MRLALVAVLALTAACTQRETVDFNTSPVQGAVLRPVLVATTRGPDPNQPVPGWERDATERFGRFVVAIPPEREVGTIPRPRSRQAADPQRDFTLAEAQMIEGTAFTAELRAALAQEPAASREAVVFVHGFNTAFIEGVYRTAQLDYDLNLPGVMLHYSWPSLGAPLAYAHDRDSALFARDGLVEMLHRVRAAGPRSTILIAHSMGAHLTMEVLRQMAITHDPAMAHLGGVILLSPDVDVELFRQQVQAIGSLPQPFVIVTSRRDRILTLSASLTGERARLGNLPDAEPLAGLGVTMIDVSEFTEGVGHFTVGTSPALIGMLDQMNAIDIALGTENAGSVPLLPATILTLQNTTEIILTPLTEASGESRGREAVLPWWLRRIFSGGTDLAQADENPL